MNTIDVYQMTAAQRDMLREGGCFHELNQERVRLRKELAALKQAIIDYASFWPLDLRKPAQIQQDLLNIANGEKPI